MKAIGGFFDRITSYDNVASAAWRAAQGKRDRGAVRAFFARFEENVNRLTRELASGDFHFDGYRAFPIRDPKTRLIHAPSFRDRVAHHAMIAVLGPVFEKGAIHHSYACRAGKGQHAALAQVRQWVRRDDAFFKADVAKYYDSIPHALLRQALARRFRERRVLALLDRLLDSYSHHPGHGLPIGALTSQYLGNFYLDPADHWVQEQLGISRYARYMDDMLLLAEPARLRAARPALAERLAELGLTVKNGGVLNHAAQGIPWLGFTVYPDRLRLNAQGRRRLRHPDFGGMDRIPIQVFPQIQGGPQISFSGNLWASPNLWEIIQGSCGFHGRSSVSKAGSGCLRLRRRFHQLERAGHSESVLQARSTALFAHAQVADDAAWRRVVCQFSRFGDTPEPEPRHARRLLEQHRQEVPLRLPQQEAPAQPQQEPGLPGSAGPPRHDGVDTPPDDACSRAPASPEAGDKTRGKTPPPADRRAWMGVTKVDGGALHHREGPFS